MILQDNDPHHLHHDPNHIYYFLILAVIMVAVLLFVGVRLMSYLDNRYKRNKTSEKSSETVGIDNEEKVK